MCADLAELLDLALLLEQVLELVVEVEVVLDRALLRRGDDDDLLDPRGDRFLDAVLDDRLVDEGQHLLGLRLGGGQEAGAPAGGREDSFADAHRTSRAGGRAGGSIPAAPWTRPGGQPPRPPGGRLRRLRRVPTNASTRPVKAPGRSTLERWLARGRTRRGGRAGARRNTVAPRREHEIEGAVDDQDRRQPYAAGARGSGAPTSARSACAPPPRQKPAGDDRRSAIRGAVADPEEAAATTPNRAAAGRAEAPGRTRGRPRRPDRRARAVQPASTRPATRSGHRSAVVDRDVAAERQPDEDGAARRRLASIAADDGRARRRRA